MSKPKDMMTAGIHGNSTMPHLPHPIKLNMNHNNDLVNTDLASDCER